VEPLRFAAISYIHRHRQPSQHVIDRASPSDESKRRAGCAFWVIGPYRVHLTDSIARGIRADLGPPVKRAAANPE